MIAKLLIVLPQRLDLNVSLTEMIAERERERERGLVIDWLID